MKIGRFLRIVWLVALSVVAVQGQAQNGKYVVDGREATRKEVSALPADAVEEMNTSVENAVPVVRVRLKPGTGHPAPAAEKAAERTVQLPAAAEPDARMDDLLRGIYEQTTLLKEGDRAADFTAGRYAGGQVSLGELRGKVVLLTFWATWCGPCLRELSPGELPEKVLDRFSGDGDFVFLPVAYTDTPESLDRFFAADGNAAYGYLKPLTCMDPDKTIHGRYATKSIPRSFVIGRDGRIALGSLGASAAESARIAAAVEKALAE